MGVETPKPASQPNRDKIRLHVSRFASTLSGAYRCFQLYKHDNKALDEILQNMTERFMTLVDSVPILKLDVTSRSLFWEGQAVGFEAVIVDFAYALRTLGVRGLQLKPPIQPRHFFQLLSVLSNKENSESKFEHLAPLMDTSESRPLLLIPMASITSRQGGNDSLLIKQLQPFVFPSAEKSPLHELIWALKFKRLPDLLSWIELRAFSEPENIQTLVLNLTDAVRNGLLSIQRFMNIFQFPPEQKKNVENMMKTDWISSISVFDDSEVEHRTRFLKSCSHLGAYTTEEIKALTDMPSHESYGLMILTRLLDPQRGIPPEQQVYDAAAKIYEKLAKENHEGLILNLLSLLKVDMNNETSVLSMVSHCRNFSIDSDEYRHILSKLKLFGEPIMIHLLKILEKEQDRGMRKKLCVMIQQLCEGFGTMCLVKSLDEASPFLARNVLMILGDMKKGDTAELLSQFLSRPEKFIRAEAIRSLGKLPVNVSKPYLLEVLNHHSDHELKMTALSILKISGGPLVIDDLILATKLIENPTPIRRELISAIGSMGGPKAKTYLESLVKKTSLLSMFGTDEKKEQELISDLLKRMK